ncbi:MAG: hypothetical protein ABFD49_07510 [Armatimonadota bacterium]|nr:hypothetical protein [bacterium]
MNINHFTESLREALADVPVLDAHTHLVGGHLGARGLHDILLYHMAVSDLYAAGCPSGARLTQYPGWPSKEEAHARIKEALPYLRYVENTSISWGIRTILKDLYDWKEPITADNWQKLDSMIRERADDKAWQRSVIGKAGIQKFVTEHARKEQEQDSDILQYSLEWAFFTRCQWGEFDTALYELERCWGELPGPPTPIGSGGRPATRKIIASVEDVHEAIAWYVNHMPADTILSMATHISTDIDFRQVSDEDMRSALTRRDKAGSEERDIYASYVNEAFLTAMERKLGGRVVFQFSYGAEPLPFETGSRLNQKSIAQLAEMIGRHPGLQFLCTLSSRHANQSLCTLCRELPNLSLAGYWWHNFFPSAIRQVMEERLDMLPTNKQIGFFSDAYCVEWTYGKLIIVKNELARVLSEKVLVGQYTMEQAVNIARQILFETPQSAMGMLPITVRGKK